MKLWDACLAHQGFSTLSVMGHHKIIEVTSWSFARAQPLPPIFVSPQPPFASVMLSFYTRYPAVGDDTKVVGKGFGDCAHATSAHPLLLWRFNHGERSILEGANWTLPLSHGATLLELADELAKAWIGGGEKLSGVIDRHVHRLRCAFLLHCQYARRHASAYRPLARVEHSRLQAELLEAISTCQSRDAPANEGHARCITRSLRHVMQGISDRWSPSLTVIRLNLPGWDAAGPCSCRAVGAQRFLSSRHRETGAIQPKTQSPTQRPLLSLLP